MGKLIVRGVLLMLVFATAMSFISLGIHALTWYWSVIGVGILVVFAGLGGLLIPSAQKAMPEEDKKAAASYMQFFGAVLATMGLVMALLAWIVGNRTLSGNDAYQVLGLLIFLALLGAGAQGVIVTLVRFAYAWHWRGREDEQQALAA